MKINVLIEYDVIKALDYVIEEVIVLVEQVKELKSKELDPNYYEAIFETYNEQIEISFYYVAEKEEYEIRVVLL